MKLRTYKSMVIFTLLLFLIAPSVHAETSQPTITVFINDEQVNFDQSPLLVNGNTLVQFRPIFEKLGYSVKWDQATQSITAQRHGNEIRMVIGGRSAYANHISYFLNESAQIIDGVSLVPLRFVAEVSGAVVSWDEDTRKVNIKIDKDEAPELKINRLIEGYAFSSSAHEFVKAITRSNGSKCNGYEVNEILFNNDKKQAIINYNLEFWVWHPRLINSEAIIKESMDITVEIKQQAIKDEDGNWYLSSVIKDREYHVVLK
ncbi:copper amine oxidase N-terminal domain-containing protein [Paenibacillus sp. HWE-109]|uniref:copper amine oxidase N-terminal domain-containing protein n=1 Tax=Paenibacillus sp. HWE-109 TaxID=1306526 RepID=UPI001EDF8927|nr:copper amine oxidase N-terminal domain-containing protein [Paenibacillus sp. HWE-109]UKS29953.1 copper amine oxidase N-terminal domain-containing protein [Paenibacillus sp. HWE-109]